VKSLDMEYEKELLERIISSSTECIVAFDSNYRYTLWNLAAETMSGLSQREVLGKSVFDVFPIQEQNGTDQYFRATLQGKTVTAKDRVCVNPRTGQKSFFDIHSSPIHNELGEVVGGIVFTRDVTTHKQTEKTLWESEARLRHIYENSPVMMHSIDEQGNICDVNSRWLEEMGYTHQEVVGRSAAFPMTTEFAELMTASVMPQLRQEGYVRDVPCQYLKKNGTVIDILLSCSATTDPFGKRITLSVTYDVTEHKRTEELLRKSEAQNQALLNAIPDLMIRMKRDGTYLDFRPAKNFTTVSSGDMYGKNLCEVMPKEISQQRLYYMEQALQTGLVQNYEFQLELDGETRFEEARIVASGKDEVLAIIRDITDRKQTEAALQQTKVKLDARVQERTAELRCANEQLQTEIAERKRVEEAILQRSRLVTLDADVGFVLIQSDTLQHILQQCVEALVRHLNAAFARIWTLSPDGNTLELQASAGMYTHIDGPHSRVPVGQFKIGKIAQDRQPHLTNTVVGDPHVNNQEWAIQEGMVAFAGYPLIAGERLVGVVAMFARQALPETDLQAMASVANMIALGIQHNRAEIERLQLLARELLARAEAETARNQIANILESITDGFYALDKDWRFTYLNQHAERLLQRSQAELIGNKIWDEFPAGDRSAILSAISQGRSRAEEC
jgi:PAS domain S-box-containing protein